MKKVAVLLLLIDWTVTACFGIDLNLEPLALALWGG